MKMRFAAVATAATAIMLFSACGDDDDSSTPTTEDSSTTPTTEAADDGTTTLAKGDVTFAGSTGLGGQTMDITAVEEEGQVTGEARFSFGLVLDVQCADTDTDGLVILGGEVTAENGDSAAVGDRVAVAIREGDPDSATIWFELPLAEGQVAAGSCEELLDAFPSDQLDDEYQDVAEGDDIETG